VKANLIELNTKSTLKKMPAKNLGSGAVSSFAVLSFRALETVTHEVRAYIEILAEQSEA
jgi:hypothetical protein